MNIKCIVSNPYVLFIQTACSIWILVSMRVIHIFICLDNAVYSALSGEQQLIMLLMVHLSMISILVLSVLCTILYYAVKLVSNDQPRYEYVHR